MSSVKSWLGSEPVDEAQDIGDQVFGMAISAIVGSSHGRNIRTPDANVRFPNDAHVRNVGCAVPIMTRTEHLAVMDIFTGATQIFTLHAPRGGSGLWPMSASHP